ncbi:Shedu anti-phage system protein SduA domain-containing protein [Pantoea sp. BAV 3049]|uniref:Shedu anti-phage system protein SduA domain-containing protein n=1 Tax=Pantoea sp. BAV 3049 TaxID=2654188 RepID=UPI00131DA82B|nr:Shedu anti-phage system protein SduA domain-containing protein [Pantoea sp. BAV 3049]
MIILHSGKLNNVACRLQLDEFRDLLRINKAIDETTLLDFFRHRPQLILLMGYMVGVKSPARYNSELPVLNKYRADFVVSDASQKYFGFIEFENAEADSVFKTKLNKKTSVYPWSSRFECGHGQVIDWLLHLKNNTDSQNMQAEFGSRKIIYSGGLIIGRDDFLNKADCRERFEDRVNRTQVDLKTISCFTFDGLYEEMELNYDVLSNFS